MLVSVGEAFGQYLGRPDKMDYLHGYSHSPHKSPRGRNIVVHG
jgi:hypothetical protein